MGRLALLLVSVSIALGVAEAIVRVLDIGPQVGPLERENYRRSKNPVLGYELAPGSRDGQYRISADGMRDRDYSVSKSPGVFRIACLGDSITYGYGSPRDQSYPRLLEGYLNERVRVPGVSYEVLNFGVSGYNITQSIENLKVRALGYKPDLVVFQYCLNDPMGYDGGLEEPRQWLPERGSRLLRASRLFALGAYTLRSRTGVDPAGSQSRPPPRQPVPVSRSYVDYFVRLHTEPATWRRVETGFDELAALSREHGFQAAVVVFPVFQDIEAYRLRAVHQKVVEAARVRSLKAIDMLDVYSSRATKGTRFIHDVLHTNPHGNRLAASAIGAELARLGLLPQPR